MPAQADDELWSAIAEPSRRQVLDLLVSHGEVSASWLAQRVPFSRQAVSKHLVVLERSGLISRRKQGREVLYQVEAGRLDQAARAMAELGVSAVIVASEPAFLALRFAGAAYLIYLGARLLLTPKDKLLPAAAAGEKDETAAWAGRPRAFARGCELL